MTADWGWQRAGRAVEGVAADRGISGVGGGRGVAGGAVEELLVRGVRVAGEAEARFWCLLPAVMGNRGVIHRAEG